MEARSVAAVREILRADDGVSVKSVVLRGRGPWCHCADDNDQGFKSRENTEGWSSSGGAAGCFFRPAASGSGGADASDIGLASPRDDGSDYGGSGGEGECSFPTLLREISARFPRLRHLTLRGLGLCQLPPAVAELFPGLVTLGLFKNRLRALPPSLGASIRRLFVAQNELQEFPAAVLGLPMLEELQLSGNKGISEVPPQLAWCCPRLDFFAMNDCSVAAFPAELLDDMELLSNPRRGGAFASARNAWREPLSQAALDQGMDVRAALRSTCDFFFCRLESLAGNAVLKTLKTIDDSAGHPPVEDGQDVVAAQQTMMELLAVDCHLDYRPCLNCRTALVEAPAQVTFWRMISNHVGGPKLVRFIGVLCSTTCWQEFDMSQHERLGSMLLPRRRFADLDPYGGVA